MELKDFTPNASWLKSPREGGILRRRTFSFFVDLFCILLTTKLLMASYMSYLKTFMYLMGEKSQYLLTSQMHKVELSVISVVFFGYFFLSYYMGNGKTPGKILFRLRVVPTDNPSSLLTLSESLKRTMGYFFCYITGFVLFALPYFNKNRDGLPDLFSSSKVLTEEQYKVAVSEEFKTKEMGTQLELDFNAKIVNDQNVIYLPGPDFYNDADKDAA
jgi:uncharacterized RDD family membrane protein YckC